MASVGKDRGVYRVRFTYEGTRHQVRLPGHNKRQAEMVASHVESLIASKLSGTSLDDLTCRWIGQIADPIFQKLSHLRLVRHRTLSSSQSESLADFLDRFIQKGRTNQGRKAAELTVRKWRTTATYLKECFGEFVSLENITPADAIDFRGWLEDKDGIESENAIRKHCQIAQMFFNAGIDAEIIHRNPFKKLPTTSVENKERDYFVTRHQFDKCVEACPDLQWKIILYLTRVAGMRCPSELVRAVWSDIDWEACRMTIHAAKTEGYEGRETRIIPLWRDLKSVLSEAWEAAPAGENRILTRYTDNAQNLRTTFTKIIKRAGLTPWPKLFQNLRASRENELIESGVPAHVAAAWIGHFVKVQQKSYLQVADHHFEESLST